MIRKLHKNIAFILSVMVVMSLLAGCGSEPTPLPEATSLPTDTPAPTNTLPPPTPTSIPLAVTVNGEAISLAEFQAEVERARSGGVESGTILASDPVGLEKWVLDQLIDQILLAQSARSSGFALDESQLQERIDALASKLGGQEALDAWMANNDFSLDGFRAAILRAAEAAWMRDKIASSVPDTTEQVHARQILVFNPTDAEQVYAQLEAGTDFETLAFTWDPVTGGDLGWFPRNYLTQPVVEDAVFDLEPGQFTGVIQSEIGYHIVQVIERDPDHPLDPVALRDEQIRTIETWLNQSRNQSDIQIFIPDL